MVIDIAKLRKRPCPGKQKEKNRQIIYNNIIAKIKVRDLT